jgi:hypothetical protein
MLTHIADKAIRQPKIALRAFKRLKNVPKYGEASLKTYMLNRGKEARFWAMENMYRRLRGG